MWSKDSRTRRKRVDPEPLLHASLVRHGSIVYDGAPGVIGSFFAVVGWPKSLLFGQGSGDFVSAIKSMAISGRIAGGFWPP